MTMASKPHRTSDGLKILSLHWTTDAPTRPGWYWHRWLTNPPSVVEVYQVGPCRVFGGDGGESYLAVNAFNDDHAHVTNMAGEWAGPIPPPADAGPTADVPTLVGGGV